MTPPTLRESADAFDERLELSNITDLRRDLLKKVDEIHENPAIRLLILKHGRPQAVLLSAEAYDVMKKAVKLLLAESDKLRPEQIIDAAIRRFEDERSTVPADVKVEVPQVSRAKAAAS
jgi:PHD/YefM family antitoxin component YafN of YafNO toxin-antitoxin module